MYIIFSFGFISMDLTSLKDLAYCVYALANCELILIYDCLIVDTSIEINWWSCMGTSESTIDC